MKKEVPKKTSRKQNKSNLPFLSLSVILIAVALASFLLWTWLVNDVFGVTGTYISALYIMQGTYAILLLVLIPVNIVLFRNKQKTVTTLSSAIHKVADGDYSFRIPVNKKAELAPIYEDFNKMCAELESVQILRNDFINNYSHEFKTPIASINGFASLLLEKKLPEAEQRQYLTIIAEESARLSKLATNTILLSKLNSQQIVTDTEEYDLSEQIRQCSIILSKSWLDKKIEFSGEFPTAVFRGNKELMQHLWLNLLNNAVKYTATGGEISVAVIPKKDFVTVIISDTGEGMDEKTQQHLFDPYYQGETSHASQGLGLGLSICKRIVELCDGTISVKSEIGAGSQFTVCLPIE